MCMSDRRRKVNLAGNSLQMCLASGHFKQGFIEPRRLPAITRVSNRLSPANLPEDPDGALRVRVRVHCAKFRPFSWRSCMALQIGNTKSTRLIELAEL
jgi:hypothetical protein